MPHWLVIDLEATTDEGGWPVTEMEIIEIGATLVDRAGREQDHFQRFVKPTRRPLLTPFCRELTHITQANIDCGAAADRGLAGVRTLARPASARLEGWASWGDYDRKQLLQEWQRLQIDSGLSRVPHMNLKQRFAKARRLERPLGLNGALQLAGMQFSGQQHRALEDARNTARLLPLVLPL